MLPLVNESLKNFEKRKQALQKINLEKATRLKGAEAIFTKEAKKGLRFFQAACCWIYTTKEGYFFALIQTKKKALFYLNQKEIFAHEKVHALRASLQNQKYEEILAFRTSSNPIRRFLGPLCSTPIEQALTFISIVSLPLLGLVPTIYPLYLVFCLLYRQKKIRQCLAFLRQINMDKEALIHLSDHEIQHLAKKQTFVKPYTLRSYKLISQFCINKTH